MSHHWDNEYFDIFGQTIGEFTELGKYMRRRVRYMDTRKLQRIRDIIAQALRDIESVIKE